MDNTIKSGILYLRGICYKEDAFQNNRLGQERVSFSVCYHPPEILTSLVALDFIPKLMDEECYKRCLTCCTPENDGPLIGIKNMYKVASRDKFRPNEIDVTSYFMSVYLKEGLIEKNEQLMDVARQIIENVDEDGVLQIFFPPREARKENRDGQVCPTVCCNAMRLLYTLGLGDEAKATEDFIYEFLESKKYLEPTLEYISPDVFLLFLSRAVINNAKAKDRFLGLIKDALKERMGTTKFPIDLSARILALNSLGLLKSEEFKEKVLADRKALRSQQGNDGSFKEDCLFRKDRWTTAYGGSAISTILGLAAVVCLK